MGGSSSSVPSGLSCSPVLLGTGVGVQHRTWPPNPSATNGRMQDVAPPLQRHCDVTAPAPATTVAPLCKRGQKQPLHPQPAQNPLCLTPPAPCCPQDNFKSFHTPLPPHGPSHTIRADPTLCRCHTVPLQFRVAFPFHDLPLPPSPGVAQSGGREETEAADTANKDRLKKQDETGAAAGAALPQAGAAPARPGEGRAGPGPALQCWRNGSRHRHSARVGTSTGEPRGPAPRPKTEEKTDGCQSLPAVLREPPPP